MQIPPVPVSQETVKIMRSQLLRLVPILFILTGLCLLSYPWISNYLFENRVDSIIESYRAEAEDIDGAEKVSILEEARQYNEQLIQAQVTLTDPFTKKEAGDKEVDYYSVLSLDGSGLMGAIEIPKISVYLPIYHGTSFDVLESGVGHLEGSSFPVGGKNTHAVLSAHTGLNSAKLFTDLTEMEKGDLFFLHIFDETLSYKVCEINIVLPEDTSKLLIQSGEDLVTLLTCTPYGVNSHRLLVTGERTEYIEEIYQGTVEKSGTESESLWMQSYKKAMLIGFSVVAVFALIVITTGRIRILKTR